MNEVSRRGVADSASPNYLQDLALYTAISALALALDYAIYWMLVSSGHVRVGVAAVTGYGCGLVLAYFLMSRKLFTNGWLAGQRGKELALFIVSGIIGLVLSYAITEAYVRFVSSSFLGAKICATLVCFVVVYLFRKHCVFQKIEPPVLPD